MFCVFRKVKQWSGSKYYEPEYNFPKKTKVEEAEVKRTICNIPQYINYVPERGQLLKLRYIAYDRMT